MPDEDLHIFSNMEFTDFDTGRREDFNKADSPPGSKPGEPASATSLVEDYGGLDFSMGAAGMFCPTFLIRHVFVHSSALRVKTTMALEIAFVFFLHRSVYAYGWATGVVTSARHVTLAAW